MNKAKSRVNEFVLIYMGYMTFLAARKSYGLLIYLRPIQAEPSRSHSARRALYYREGGECWPVRPDLCFF